MPFTFFLLCSLFTVMDLLRLLTCWRFLGRLPALSASIIPPLTSSTASTAILGVQLCASSFSIDNVLGIVLVYPILPFEFLWVATVKERFGVSKQYLIKHKWFIFWWRNKKVMSFCNNVCYSQFKLSTERHNYFKVSYNNENSRESAPSFLYGHGEYGLFGKFVHLMTRNTNKNCFNS